MGLRARLTALATAVVAAGLVAGALLLGVALRASLLASLDDAGRAVAADVATLAEQDRLPASLPAGAALVQVVDAHQRVRAASPGADRLVPLLDAPDLAAVRGGRAREVAGARVARDGRLRVVGVGAGSGADLLTVLVASPLDQVEDSARVVRRGLAVGAPLLLLGVAALAWVLVGSVLRPVAELRRGAAEITGTGDLRRLPVPPVQDELHRLAVTLNDMLERLDTAGARQRTFVADAAHELRSPLASARTQLEVDLAHPDGVDWPATAAEVLADVQRLGRLVDDLLLLARADAPGARRAAGVVDLADVAAAAVARHHGPLDVRLAAPSPQPVRANADALGRVVTNLLDNAVRHARTRVRVDVRGPEGGQVLLTVDDDGPGIAPADRERVFERFTRLDEGRGRDDGGSGLGLAIVAELVRSLGGTVELGDAPDGGLR
ncbi:MAG TPA: HAMP domain-containing sensor histidine kinase, partial [Actinomycetales bacterium]